MYLTDHLTDEQLNAYLDHELKDRGQAELHFSSCKDCAARLASLRALFDEIESLPELPLSQDLAEPIERRLSRNVSLPRSLRLAVTLQVAAAVVALIFAAPLVTQFISTYVFSLQAPYPAEILLQLQTQWRTWLYLLSQLRLPTMPEIPVIELSSAFMTLVMVGLSLLWLIGNGLLLKNQTN